MSSESTMTPSGVVKLYSEEHYNNAGLVMGKKIMKEHPGWSSTWQIVYVDRINSPFIDGKYYAFEYLYEKIISLEEAEVICPEALI